MVLGLTVTEPVAFAKGVSDKSVVAAQPTLETPSKQQSNWQKRRFNESIWHMAILR